MKKTLFIIFSIVVAEFLTLCLHNNSRLILASWSFSFDDIKA